MIVKYYNPRDMQIILNEVVFISIANESINKNINVDE